MDWQQTPYTIPLFLSGGLSLGLAYYSWRRREAPGAAAIAALMLAVSVWALAYALEMSSPGLGAKNAWAGIEYVGIVTVPTMWLVFCARYTGRDSWLTQGGKLLLLIEPLATVLLLWTNEAHHLMRSSVELHMYESFSVVAISYGPWFWIHTAYSYVMLLTGSVLLLPIVLRSPFLYKRQVASLLVAALSPWLANALYVFRLSPFPHLDLTPFSFLILGGAIAWGHFRFHLVDVVPVARGTIVENMRDGVIVFDLADRVVDINPAAREMLGELPDDVIGHAAADVLSQLPPVEALLQDRETVEELVLEGGDSPRTFETRVTVLRDGRDSVRGRLLVLYDVSERKRAERELVRAQRLRAVGELSLGISHNLNNILTGILGPAARLKQTATDEGVALQVERILSSAARARALVKRLGRAQRTEDAPEALLPVDLSQATNQHRQDNSSQRGIDIPLVTELAEAPAVAAHRAELHDILLNLIYNAIDAMPDGGTLAIATSPGDGHARLVVSDEGIGMEEEVRARVFEPFFTTKASIGTGLGLSTAHSSITAWGGAISVSSRPGEGTSFVVELPFWQGELADAAPEKDTEAPLPPATRHARILIAEDEAVVALLLTEALNSRGHRAELASDGEQALATFVPGRYEVILLDLTMPGLSGDRVAAEIRARDPLAVLVLMTGWEMASDDPRLTAFDLSLQKPFDEMAVEQVVGKAVQLYDSRVE